MVGCPLCVFYLVYSLKTILICRKMVIPLYTLGFLALVGGLVELQ